jgi:thiol:disulfide interchange protein DsbD
MRRLPLLVFLLAVCSAANAASGSAAPVQSGLGPYLAFCIGGGFLSLLTPCVFPMIPVTVSYFSKRSGSRPILSATIYALGIVSTFAIIGVGAAAIFGAAGLSNFAANPWVNLAIGLLFVVLALNLFGVFEFTALQGAAGRIQGTARREGLFGPFLMGIAFSLTSFTCTTPVVATLLATATKGSLGMPAFGMTAYGITFASPFFLLALFPSAMNRKPKSGAWLAAVKPALGFVELAAAVKFFSNCDLALSLGLLTRPVVAGLWTALFLVLAVYLVGRPSEWHSVGWGRRTLAVVSLAISAFLFGGIRGQSLGQLDAYLPPDPYPFLHPTSRPATENGPILAMDYKDGLAKAKASGRPLFVDFTGVTCVNCRWMEDNIFPKDPIKKEFSGMVRVQLWTDRPNASDQANQKLLADLSGAQSLPTYVVVSPSGKVLGKFLGATNDVNEFAEFLEKARQTSLQ